MCRKIMTILLKNSQKFWQNFTKSSETFRKSSETRAQLDALNHSNQVGWKVFFYNREPSDDDREICFDRVDLPPELH